MLEKVYLENEKLNYNDLTTETALVEMRRSEISPAGAKHYSFLQKVWEPEKMQSYEVFFALVQYQRRCSNIEGCADNGPVFSQQRCCFAQPEMYFF